MASRYISLARRNDSLISSKGLCSSEFWSAEFEHSDVVDELQDFVIRLELPSQTSSLASKLAMQVSMTCSGWHCMVRANLVMRGIISNSAWALPNMKP